MFTRRRLLAATVATPLVAASSRGPALGSRRGEAVPITIEERGRRLDRARELMGRHRLNAICLTGGGSLQYFTGIQWGGSERLFAVVLPREGAAFCVCPAFEEERAREQLAKMPGGASARVYTWQEDQDPYALTARALWDAGLPGHRTGITRQEPERVGMDERVPYVFANGIAKASAGLEFTSATPVTAGCRARKSAAELALLHLANSITLQAYEAAWKQLREGMTTAELSALIGAAYDRLGFPGYASVQTGAFSALPHGSVQPQKILEGAIVMIDDGCSVEGYQSDITRTFVLGKPTSKMKHVFDVVRQAQSAALAAARPGEPCEAVDSAARRVITSAGFGPDYTFFTHRVGHGIGLEGHEWPYLVRGNRQLLEPGMTFSDEPGVYIRGEFGVRLEDDMYITEAGAQLFTPQSRSLEDPFGKS